LGLSEGRREVEDRDLGGSRLGLRVFREEGGKGLFDSLGFFLQLEFKLIGVKGLQYFYVIL